MANLESLLDLRDGCFLLATPALNGSQFHDSIIFLAEYACEFPFGYTINKPVHMPLDEVFNRSRNVQEVIPNIDDVKARHLHTFFFGGPIQNTTPFQKLSVSILEVGKSVFKAPKEITPSVFLSKIPPEMAVPVSQLTSPANETARLFFGYTGWEKTQLENEILDGYWDILSIPPIDVFSLSRDKTPLTTQAFRKIYERSGI